MLRKCTRCEQTLGFSNFGNQKFGKYGLRSRCKKCENQRTKEWHKSHQKEDNQRMTRYGNSLKGRDNRSNRIYYISISDMLEWQNYKCAICRVKENGKKLHVDHNEKPFFVRMLLCLGCNNGTGMKDNPVLCETKAKYLRAYLP